MLYMYMQSGTVAVIDLRDAVLSMHILSASHAVAQPPNPVTLRYSSDENLREWEASNLSLFRLLRDALLIYSHACE